MIVEYTEVQNDMTISETYKKKSPNRLNNYSN